MSNHLFFIVLLIPMHGLLIMELLLLLLYPLIFFLVLISTCEILLGLIILVLIIFTTNVNNLFNFFSYCSLLFHFWASQLVIKVPYQRSSICVKSNCFVCSFYVIGVDWNCSLSIYCNPYCYWLSFQLDICMLSIMYLFEYMLLIEIDLLNNVNFLLIYVMCCLFIFIVVMLCSCLLLCHIIYGDIIIVDLICCCIPFVILLTLFSPVFLLLYHLDVLIIPSTTVEILGNQ